MVRLPRRLLALIALACAAALLCMPMQGCSGPDGYKTFVAAADVAANETIGPRYERYVSLDPALTVEQKATYLNELQAFRATVAEAKLDARPAGP